MQAEDVPLPPFRPATPRDSGPSASHTLAEPPLSALFVPAHTHGFAVPQLPQEQVQRIIPILQVRKQRSQEGKWLSLLPALGSLMPEPQPYLFASLPQPPRQPSAPRGRPWSPTFLSTPSSSLQGRYLEPPFIGGETEARSHTAKRLKVWVIRKLGCSFLICTMRVKPEPAW